MGRALKIICVSLMLGLLLSTAGSIESQKWLDIPIFGLCIGIAFVIQWIAFIPSYLKRTELIYDLTGSLTYIFIITLIIVLTVESNVRSVILAVMITTWAVRLGSFLFIRILIDGSDDRFDSIKSSPIRFLAAWTLQGLWVCVTASVAIAAMVSTKEVALDWLAVIGAVFWLGGFSIEVVADYQKRAFKTRKDQNKCQFITSGLWAYSRHPNYFGEIVLWIGVSIFALPALVGWSYITLISPIFVTLLITRVSGIPILEKKADLKFSGEPVYEAYKSQTPVLIPKLFRVTCLRERPS